jgi:hypothetical protein
LYLDGSPFRFASFNCPNLHINEDPWSRATPFEQADALESLSQMKMPVTRIYTLSIPSSASDTSRHIAIASGYGTSNVTFTLNERLMRDMDSALFLAGVYNIKIIIPLIDRWEWWGGVKSFAKM